MLSGSLHDLHETIDGSVDGLAPSLPAGSLGDIVHGLLNIPGALIATLEYVLLGFGS